MFDGTDIPDSSEYKESDYDDEFTDGSKDDMNNNADGDNDDDDINHNANENDK